MTSSHRHFQHRKARASALLLVLYALLLLSASVLAWVKFIDQEMLLGQEKSLGLQARGYAFSGLQIGLHPQVTRMTTALLEASFGTDRGYKVRLVSEAGKLNINWLLAGENQARLDILKRYLERRGLNFQEREVLVDCMLDWVDADDTHRINGVEKTDGYQAANMAFQGVDEIRQVWGSQPLVSKPGWEDDLTVYTQGQIDLMSASVEVLSVLPGVNEDAARRFVEMRQGPDKIDGTQDDLVLPKGNEMNTALSYLGLTQSARQQLQNTITINDQTWRIISDGWVGKVHRQIEVVARKGNATPDILSWKEH
jgi:general secretion pathway protein K